MIANTVIGINFKNDLFQNKIPLRQRAAKCRSSSCSEIFHCEVQKLSYPTKKRF